MLSLGWPEILVVCTIAMLLFGSRLPELDERLRYCTRQRRALDEDAVRELVARFASFGKFLAVSLAVVAVFVLIDYLLR